MCALADLHKILSTLRLFTFPSLKVLCAYAIKQKNGKQYIRFISLFYLPWSWKCFEIDFSCQICARDLVLYVDICFHTIFEFKYIYVLKGMQILDLFVYNTRTWVLISFKTYYILTTKFYYYQVTRNKLYLILVHIFLINQGMNLCFILSLASRHSCAS